MVMLPNNAPRFTPPPFQHGRVFILGVPYVPESAACSPVYRDGKMFAVSVGQDVFFSQDYLKSEIVKAHQSAGEDLEVEMAEARSTSLLRGIVVASMVWVFALVIVGVVLT